MPDPSPSPAPSGSIFGRKPSLFSSKKLSRKDSLPPVSPPLPEETSPLAPARRDSSVLSLPSSGNNEDSLRRSGSVRSHESQSSLAQHKGRGSSVALPSRSPIRLHRQSRSISAHAATIKTFGTNLSPQKSSESISPNARGRENSITEPVQKTPFSMLVAPFGHTLKRAETDRPQLASHPTGSAVSLAAPSQSQPNSSAFTPAAALNHIHETCRKRIATLEYLRKVYEGHMYYFNTVLYTPANLGQLPSLQFSKLGRRAASYVLLGISIPPLLDLNSGSPLEYLRSLAALLSEFETYRQWNSPDTATGARGRMGAMFKSGMRGYKGRRASTVTESQSDPVESAHLDSMPLPPTATGHHPDFTYLQTPVLPFDPDFATAFATLADILVDTYSAVIQLLSSPEAVGPGVGEAFTKADKVLRKVLVQNVVQELGDATRREVRSEISGLGKVVLSGLVG